MEKTLIEGYTIINEDNKYTVNQRICRLSVKKVLNVFVYYSINRNSYFLKFDDGIKQTNLRKEDVLNCPICIPKNRMEQQKIADCLSSLDDLIAEQSNKLKALQQHKRGLMQQIFPSI